MADTVSYDYSKVVSPVYTVSASGNKPIATITCTVDVPAIFAAAAGTGLASASKITAGESVTIATVPLGFQVLGVVAYVKTGGGTGTIDIGIPASEACYIAALSTVTAAVWDYSDTDTYSMAASSGWLVTSRASDADNVIVQFNSDETLPVIIVRIWGIDHADLLNY